MLIETNTIFTNWLFDICLKRKAMNNAFDNKYDGDDNSDNEFIKNKSSTNKPVVIIDEGSKEIKNNEQ